MPGFTDLGPMTTARSQVKRPEGKAFRTFPLLADYTPGMDLASTVPLVGFLEIIPLFPSTVL
jgi:hypothetical protein